MKLFHGPIGDSGFCFVFVFFFRFLCLLGHQCNLTFQTNLDPFLFYSLTGDNIIKIITLSKIDSTIC